MKRVRLSFWLAYTIRLYPRAWELSALTHVVCIETGFGPLMLRRGLGLN